MHSVLLDLFRKKFINGFILSQNESNLVLYIAFMSKAFEITRIFNAPLDLFWKVNTEAQHLKEWWGPKGLTMLATTIDLKPGGIFHYGMQTPDGHEMWGKFVYREIIPQNKMVYVVSFSDKDAGITRHPMSNTWPLEMLSTVNFTEENGKTKMTTSAIPINETEEDRATFEGAFEGMTQGFTGTFDQLDAYLTKIQS
jgi:uncharacterized protein YndB with AHSA1/START domain